MVRSEFRPAENPIFSTKSVVCFHSQQTITGPLPSSGRFARQLDAPERADEERDSVPSVGVMQKFLAAVFGMSNTVDIACISAEYRISIRLKDGSGQKYPRAISVNVGNSRFAERLQPTNNSKSWDGIWAFVKGSLRRRERL